MTAPGDLPPEYGPEYVTLEQAAGMLDMSVSGLRSRCWRTAPDADGRVQLGGSIYAIKFGRSWRLRFPLVR